MIVATSSAHFLTVADATGQTAWTCALTEMTLNDSRPCVAQRLLRSGTMPGNTDITGTPLLLLCILGKHTKSCKCLLMTKAKWPSLPLLAPRPRGKPL